MTTSTLVLGAGPRVQGRIDVDPRPTQLAILSVLLAYGVFALGFVLSAAALPAAVGAAWATESLLQGVEQRRAPPGWSPRHLSAIISAFSTLLLFRSEHAWTYAALVAAALLSKRLFRVNGRHFINPTNGAIVLGSLVLPGWIGSGQWGHGAVLAFVLASGGALVLSRAARLDTALAFLGGTAAFLALRNLAFGYPWPTLGHAFTSGTLWVFALYMITDPKTTPQVRGARIAHGLLVAGLAVTLQQLWYVRDAFLWALFACAPLVPLFDRLSPPQPQTATRK